MCAGAVCALVLAAAPAPAAAQSTFEPPRPPCDVKPGHYLVQGAVVYFNLATNPRYADQRDKNLREALRVLAEALGEERQGGNPAAWYYLGRYYALVADPAGGDSAFRRAVELAPQCAADVAAHRERLRQEAMASGYRAWQEAREDSALAVFAAVHRLAPTHPEALFRAGELLATRGRGDTAMVLLRRAAAAAAGDTAFGRDRRNALATIARLSAQPVFTDTTVARWLRLRGHRDSVTRVLAVDSTVLFRMDSAATARRARRAVLSPADQRRFSADSARRAEAVARGRAELATIASRAAADSAAAGAVLGPAIAAQREYVEAFPDARDALTTLPDVYGASGRTGEATAFFDSLVARLDVGDPDVLFDLGRRLIRAGLAGPGARALGRGVSANPYHRGGLYDHASVLVSRADPGALDAARRLSAVDPLNRASLRLVAAAWEQRGRADSATVWRSRADSLTVELAVYALASDSGSLTVTLAASNLRAAPSAAFGLAFEFVAPDGTVRAAEQREVPSLAPGGLRTLEFRTPRSGPLGWRYRARE
jgi:tetratricopeptide (TPR) repeat protein